MNGKRIISWLRSPLGVIYVLAVIGSVAMLASLDVLTSVDSFSYRFAIRSLAGLKPHISRTPSYPILLGMCYAVSDMDTMFRVAVVVQHIIYLCSIAFFHRTLEMMNARAWVRVTLVACYALLPCLTVMCQGVFTECLAFVGVMMLVYAMLRLRERASWPRALHYGWWMLFLVMLRPSLAYLLPLAAAAWGVALWRGNAWRAAAPRALAMVAAVTALLLAYMAAYRATYGVFTTTSVGTMNQYYILRHEGLIDPAAIHHPAMRDSVERSIALHGAVRTVDDDTVCYEGAWFIRKYGLPAVQQVVDTTISAHRAEVARLAWQRFVASCRMPMLACEQTPLEPYFERYSPPLGTLYVFLVFYAVVIAWRLRRRRDVWLDALLWLMVAGNIVVYILGAQSQWPRLAVPLIPAVMMLLARLVAPRGRAL